MGKRKGTYMKKGGSKRAKYELQAGMKGYLVTFATGKEKPCRSEAYALLNRYADQVYGPNNPGSGTTGLCDSDESEDDIEKALAKEIEREKSDKKSLRQRFVSVASGCNHSLFISTTLADPSLIFSAVLKSLTSTQEDSSSDSALVDDSRVGSRVHPGDGGDADRNDSSAHKSIRDIQCRNILRMIPITITCRADREKVAMAVKEAVQAVCASEINASQRVTQSPKDDCNASESSKGSQVCDEIDVLPDKTRSSSCNPRLSFCVLFKHSNSNMFTRNEAIQVTTEVMKGLNPLNHVSLTSPDVYIYVEVVRSVACVGVLRDYFKYKKFNLQELTVSKCLGENQVSSHSETVGENQSSSHCETPVKSDSSGAPLSEPEGVTDSDLYPVTKRHSGDTPAAV